jgi:hypothetical protein
MIARAQLIALLLLVAAPARADLQVTRILAHPFFGYRISTGGNIETQADGGGMLHVDHTWERRSGLRLGALYTQTGGTFPSSRVGAILGLSAGYARPFWAISAIVALVSRSDFIPIWEATSFGLEARVGRPERTSGRARLVFNTQTAVTEFAAEITEMVTRRGALELAGGYHFIPGLASLGQATGGVRVRLSGDDEPEKILLRVGLGVVAQLDTDVREGPTIRSLGPIMLVGFELVR